MPVDQLFGEDDEDTDLLKSMARAARQYLESQKWCAAVGEGYFANGIGGVLAIFLFRIEPRRHDLDSWIWVVDGDIPSAYLPLEDASSAKEVFETYVAGMRRWVAVVRKERPDGPDIPPVNVPPTLEWASNLESRLAVLMETIPRFLEDPVQ